MVENEGKDFRGHFSARENFFLFREGLPGVPIIVPPSGKKADFPAGGSEIAPPDMEKTGRRRQCQPAIC